MIGSGAYVHNEDCKRENDILRLITESTAPRTAHLAKITAEHLLQVTQVRRILKRNVIMGII